MLAKLTSLLFMALLGLLLFGLLLWWLQPRLIFFPYDRLQATPTDWGLDYEEVKPVTEDDVTLHGWLVAPPKPRATAPRTLLFFHGNAGNVSHRGDSIRIFTELGFEVLIIDYRGYGRSEGTPSEPGLYQDATAAWDWLTQVRGIPPEEIVLFGRSLGGAVATWLAARTSPAALIVESSFDRMQSLAEVHYPLLSRLVPLRVAFPAVEQMASVHAPVLILHSPDDEIVPVQLGRRLYEAAPDPKGFVELQGGHNEGFLRSKPQYQQALTAFLESITVPDTVH
ncbi:MAG: alpha/beta hydrolase [Lamprobacter sp.]|uniref:alpha/beta hydrolase n=1 Tax=Lamprobacter sp. TaxID=3100796 RepID=UPI002B26218A|nr:alpha/beta hydrolase [Lamprobacter sp.]MEA3642997.1 alpha/beta hydrolase [Lamprobacter sp.]